MKQAIDNSNFVQFSEEGYKLFFDFFKHMTTLSTGSILILATFLDKFDSNPERGIWIKIAFIGFICSMISAAIMMFIYSTLVGYRGKYGNVTSIIGGYVVIFCISSFSLGVIALVYINT